MEKQKNIYEIGKRQKRFSIDITEEPAYRRSQSETNSAVQINLRAPTFEHEDASINLQMTLGPIFNNMQTTMITQRRHRKKVQSKQSTVKQELTEYTRKRLNDRGQMKKLVRITDFIKLFFDKLTCNSPLRSPVEYDPFENELEHERYHFFCELPKIQLPKMVENILMVAKILYIIIYFFAFPLSLLFDQVSFSFPMLTLKILGLVLTSLDVFQTLQINATRDQIACLSTQQLQSLGQHRKQSFFLQIVILIVTSVSIIMINEHIRGGAYFFIGMALNIKRYLNQNQKLQQQFFTATHYQKYWDLIKVLCMNLLVCHLLACILISITYFQPNQSWMSLNQIDRAAWYEQYIWSYYFGTTIILTIGFGDLHPANCVQSFFIIFISFFACVFFGYNINYIGNLINSIRQEEVQKNSKLRVLNSLAKKAHVSRSVHSQISNYIIQQSKIKQQSNYTQQKHLLQELPDSLRSSFLQQANQRLFNHLKKMVPFTNRTVERLSLAIQAKICHPDQTIKRASNNPTLMILQSGEVGYVARSKSSRLNNLIIQRITCSFDNQSKIVCADLLSGLPLNYDIKSLAYSIIYEMNRQQFQQSINHVRQDYELYRQILDRCKYKLYQFALVRCRYCENRLHTLFECPRLHFQPFRRTLPLKYCNSKISERQPRVHFIRNKKAMDFQFALQCRYSNDLNESGLSLCQSLKNINSKLLSRSQARQNKAPPTHINKNRNERDSYQLTIEMITQLRQDIRNLKRQSTNAKFQFTLWQNVDCDQACSFKYYFPKFNSNTLGEKVIKTTLINWTRSIKKKVKKPLDA